jgi:hypothetical protein
VAAIAGLRTVVINWWATWPASATAGTIVTDRATLRLERGGDLDAEIAPPELYQALRSKWPALRSEAAALARQLHGTGASRDLLQRSGELDALQMAIARETAGANVDLSLTYLPGLDLVQHGLLTTAGAGAPSASTVAASLQSLDEYYVFLDTLLTPVLSPAAGELTMIVTSRGRVQGSTQGMFVVRGAAANPQARDVAAQATDIMPTMLYALGLPVSRELRGRVLIELFSAEFAKRYPVREVTTYGAPSLTPAPRAGRPLDQEMIDRLRSLGYVR